MNIVDVTISLAGEVDLPLLEREGKAAVDCSFAEEYSAQCRGEQSIYIAVADGHLLGSGFIRWLGPRDPEAQALCPDAPEILRLEVAETMQSKGIGTKLIAALCSAAKGRGFNAVSLGVAHENPRAFALYRRLGFEQTPLTEYYDEYQYPLEGGGYGVARDLCRYLVKRFSAGADS